MGRHLKHAQTIVYSERVHVLLSFGVMCMTVCSHLLSSSVVPFVSSVILLCSSTASRCSKTLEPQINN